MPEKAMHNTSGGNPYCGEEENGEGVDSGAILLGPGGCYPVCWEGIELPYFPFLEGASDLILRQIHRHAIALCQRPTFATDSLISIFSTLPIVCYPEAKENVDANPGHIPRPHSRPCCRVLILILSGHL